MKKVLWGLIGFLSVINSYGQELKVNMEIDTLKIIQTEKLTTKEIGFGIPYGKYLLVKHL